MAWAKCTLGSGDTIYVNLQYAVTIKPSNTVGMGAVIELHDQQRLMVKDSADVLVGLADPVR
jgi:hypothetical protein